MAEVLLLLVAIAFFARRGRGTSARADALPGILAEAAAAGIITAAQREQLLGLAAAHPTVRRGRLGGAGWLAVCAGLFVVAGVSLLIARNWEDIGAVARVGAFLLLLLAAGEGAIRARGRSAAVGVPLEVLWFFLPLLGIGLYGQTFQLSGDPLQPFLVWLGLVVPLAWGSERPIVATMHVGALVAVVLVGNFVAEPARLFLGEATGMLQLTGTPVPWGAWLMTLGLLALASVESVRLLPRHRRHHVVGVWAVWIFAVLVASTWLRVEHEGWIVLAAVALATLWVVVLIALDASAEERGTGTAAWLATIYGLTFTWHMADPASGDAAPAGLAVIGAAVVAAIGGAALLPAERLSGRPTWALAAKALLVSPIVIAFLYLGTDVRLVWLAAAAMNGLLVVVAVGLMWHGSLAREPAHVNLGVLVLVGVLITRFLDVFGNMLRSGIGFIVAGVLLAGLAWALERTRRRLLGASA